MPILDNTDSSLRYINIWGQWDIFYENHVNLYHAPDFGYDNEACCASMCQKCSCIPLQDKRRKHKEVVPVALQLYSQKIEEQTDKSGRLNSQLLLLAVI